MLTKVIGKAITGTAAAGIVLVPTTTVSTQFTNVACDYPDTITTSTDVDLRYRAAPYGSENVATVTVSSGAGTPRGRVVLEVGSAEWTLRLKGGSVSQSLPRTLDAGETYDVTARFRGNCSFRNSSDSEEYTVTKAGVNVNPTVLNERRGRFAAAFRGSGGLDPQGGQARFVVTNRRGRVIDRESAGVEDGRASVDMKNLRRGSYRLTVTYSGTPNFAWARDAVGFRVGRR